MATISFYAGQFDASGTYGTFQIADLAGSGLGFYGGGFGESVAVGQAQDKTFVTNSTGTSQGVEAWNVKYANSGSGLVGRGSTAIPLKAIPNWQSTLNIRFSNASAVRTQNIKAYIYDRVLPTSPASGVTTYLAEIVHPVTVQDSGSPTGSGSTAWEVFTTANQATPTQREPVTLTSSPGSGGLRPSGSNTTDVRHDWYLALSASPDGIGSKQFGLWVQLEYL
jgi:hypothetical protein